MAPNYVLGRGQVFFSPFTTGTQTVVNPGERLFGNCPSFNLAQTATMLDHFSSQFGVKERDDSTLLEIKRDLTLVCDDIQKENVALWFLGSNVVSTAAGSSGVNDGLLASGVPDRTYQMGVSVSNPQGVRNVANVVVRNQVSPSGATVYVAGTDYTVDAAHGRIYIVPGGGINNSPVYWVYDVLASSRATIISGSTPIEGQMRYVANNPKGLNKDVFLPWVLVQPSQNYDLIGDTWQQFTFALEIKKLGTLASVYVDGQAA